ncbi:MAG: response regulator [Nitrospirota bacterium]|jgi:DNA-binding response OmpR family regulator
MQILVVDDEREIRDSVSEILRIAGYKVLTAADGEEARRCIETEKISMMLMDLCMPGMNGEELLMSLDKNPKRPPTLVITALAPWQLMHLMKAGIGYIRKPINSALLLGAVETVLRKEAAHES